MIESTALIALVVYFLHFTTKEGMVNNWVHKTAFRLPAWVKKPLYDCPICMAPYYGAALLLSGVLPCSGWLQGAVICAAAAGLNAVIVQLTQAWLPFDEGENDY